MPCLLFIFHSARLIPIESRRGARFRWPVGLSLLSTHSGFKSGDEHSQVSSSSETLISCITFSLLMASTLYRQSNRLKLRTCGRSPLPECSGDLHYTRFRFGVEDPRRRMVSYNEVYSLLMSVIVWPDARVWWCPDQVYNEIFRGALT